MSLAVDRGAINSPSNEDVIITITETLIGIHTNLGVVGLCLGWK